MLNYVLNGIAGPRDNCCKGPRFAYRPFIRPILEKGAVCWDPPCGNLLIEVIEKVHRKTAKRKKMGPGRGHEKVIKLEWEGLQNEA